MAAFAGDTYLVDLCGYEYSEAVANAASDALLATSTSGVLAKLLAAEGGVTFLTDLYEEHDDPSISPALGLLCATCHFTDVRFLPLQACGTVGDDMRAATLCQGG